MKLTQAVVIQSTIIRGRIQSIEMEKTPAAPGVLDVMTYLNAPELSRSLLGMRNAIPAAFNLP